MEVKKYRATFGGFASSHLDEPLLVITGSTAIVAANYNS